MIGSVALEAISPSGQPLRGLGIPYKVPPQPISVDREKPSFNGSMVDAKPFWAALRQSLTAIGSDDYKDRRPSIFETFDLI